MMTTTTTKTTTVKPKKNLKFMEVNREQGWNNHMGSLKEPIMKSSSPSLDSTDFGEEPFYTVCPSCHSEGMTWTRKGPSSMSWCLCAIMCIFMCCPFCLIPFCCSSLDDTKHYCEHCNALLGKHRPWKKHQKHNRSFATV